MSRLRVRLQRGRSGDAGHLGSAVRRLLQQRGDDRRPVRVVRPRQVGTALAPDHAAAARLRGQRARALERAHRALPAALRQRQHAPRQLHDTGAVFPPAAQPGTAQRPAAAGRLHAEEPAAPQGIDVQARGPQLGPIPAGHRRSHRHRNVATRCARCCSAPAGSTTSSILAPQRAEATDIAIARVEQLYPLPVDAILDLVASYPNLERLYWVQEEPQNMGAWGSLERALGAGAAVRTSSGITSAGRAAPARRKATRARINSSRNASSPMHSPPRSAVASAIRRRVAATVPATTHTSA